MSDPRTATMQVNLVKNGATKPLTVHFKTDGSNLVKIHGMDEGGVEHAVSLVVREPDNGGCYVCLEPPCPPGQLVYQDPCPFNPPLG